MRFLRSVANHEHRCCRHPTSAGPARRPCPPAAVAIGLSIGVHAPAFAGRGPGDTAPRAPALEVVLRRPAPASVFNSGCRSAQPSAAPRGSPCTCAPRPRRRAPGGPQPRPGPVLSRPAAQAPSIRRPARRIGAGRRPSARRPPRNPRPRPRPRSLHGGTNRWLPRTPPKTPSIRPSWSATGAASPQPFARQQNYPRVAAMRGWEGEVRCDVSPARQHRGCQVVRSSGFEVLDQSAVQLVSGAGPCPARRKPCRTGSFRSLCPCCSNWRNRHERRAPAPPSDPKGGRRARRSAKSPSLRLRVVWRSPPWRRLS